MLPGISWGGLDFYGKVGNNIGNDNFRFQFTRRYANCHRHNVLLLFVGSYAEAADPGVYVYELDMSSGKMNRLSAVSELKNPTFVSVDEANGRLYAISETVSEGERIGEAAAFAIDSAKGELSELNRTLTIRPSSSHIQLDRSNRFVAVSGYHGGNVGLVNVGADGLVGKLADERQHEGKGADPARQDRPHPHSVIFSPDNRFALVADLGLDLIVVYELDAQGGRLVRKSEAQTPPGAGPRHMAFHPNGRFLYSINEVNSSLSAFRIIRNRAGWNCWIRCRPCLPGLPRRT
ncbi:hypothetical protein HMSSN036_35110 [Paenibacillus macerans]|nr:hypothetical protein HMSSN036_35110 [Paenibacillus macerans]